MSQACVFGLVSGQTDGSGLWQYGGAGKKQVPSFKYNVLNSSPVNEAVVGTMLHAGD